MRTGTVATPDPSAVAAMPRLAILLATYNGERYLRQQLDSLLGQSQSDWTLFVRDDGSQDSTPALIDSYARRERRIVTIDAGSSNIGPLRGFSRLLQKVRHDFDYVMFCDQDDEWLPDKVASTLQRMLDLERANPGAPLLVHSDLMVVDSAGRVMCPSFWAYSGIDPAINSLSRLLFQNTVTGCTALLNRPLLELLDETPAGAVVHDWWTALVAAAFGRVEPLRRPTVRYRQHAGNLLGARERSRLPFASAATALVAETASWRRRRHELIERPLEQARALGRHFGNRLRPDAQRMLSGLAQFDEMSWWARRAFLLERGCLRQRLGHSAALLLLA